MTQADQNTPPWDTGLKPKPAIDWKSWREGALFVLRAFPEELNKTGELGKHAEAVTRVAIAERDRMMTEHPVMLDDHVRFAGQVKELVVLFMDVDPAVASLSDIVQGVSNLRQSAPDAEL